MVRHHRERRRLRSLQLENQANSRNGGRREQLEGKIQERYGIAKDQARQGREHGDGFNRAGCLWRKAR
jgi:hypothetical protein